MHPIERLRFVARADGVPSEVLVTEAASALTAFRDDPAGLVTACRRIVSRQPACGPLWWACSLALCAPEPWVELREAVARVQADRTGRTLVDALPEEATVVVVGSPEQTLEAFGRRGDLRVIVADTLGDARYVVRTLQAREVEAEEVDPVYLAEAVRSAEVVVLDAAVVGARSFVAPVGSYLAAAAAAVAGVPVWLAAGVGRVLPDRVAEVVAGRIEAAAGPYEGDWEVVPTSLVERVFGPDGWDAPEAARARVDCPVAPELFVELLTI